jgi:hypothetical protein
MLTLNVDDFMLEFKEGTLEHVGPPTQSATAKLYDVEGVEVREFGDNRVKLVFHDGEGNELEIAVFPEQATAVADGIEALRDESEVFE